MEIREVKRFAPGHAVKKERKKEILEHEPWLF